MKQLRSVGGNIGAALDADFQVEADLLIEEARLLGPAEGAMRLRALGEISHLLPTEGLLALAVAVSVTRRDVQPR